MTTPNDRNLGETQDGHECLRQVAEAALEGQGPAEWLDEFEARRALENYLTSQSRQMWPFLVAASPAIVLALLDENERLRAAASSPL